jgi:hypothetical protein
VWARGNVRLNTCPKSYITPESLEWLESYHVGKLFGFGDPNGLPARAADAFCVLEQEIVSEKNNDER